MKDYQGVKGTHIGYCSISLVAVTVLLLAVASCAPIDDHQDNISLAGAQEIVPFPICMPAYLPEGITLDPKVAYHADFGDPMESDVRLRYFDSHSGELAIEIYQRHSPGSGTGEIAMEYKQVYKSYERELLWWEGVLIWSRGRERYTIPEDHIIITREKYYDEDTSRWIFQFEEPMEIQANMIIWGNDPVDYHLYTHLSLEQAQEIA